MSRNISHRRQNTGEKKKKKKTSFQREKRKKTLNHGVPGDLHQNQACLPLYQGWEVRVKAMKTCKLFGVG